jgi:hypothetical protein
MQIEPRHRMVQLRYPRLAGEFRSSYVTAVSPTRRIVALVYVVSECVREHRAVGVIDRHGVGRPSAGGSGGRVHLGHGGRVVGLQNVPPPPLPPGVGTQWITTPHSACATGANKTAAATAAASAIMALRSRAGSPLCVDSAAGMNATGTLSLRTSQRPSSCCSTRRSLPSCAASRSRSARAFNACTSRGWVPLLCCHGRVDHVTPRKRGKRGLNAHTEGVW